MNGETRREKIVARLTGASAPISASKLAEELGVSRQVIVQDVALLRATGCRIASLARGYVLETGQIVQTADAKQLLNDDSVRKAYLGG